ncbi:MAG TPA: menaquinone biosynthesis protein [Chitinophagaceae bacterium]|nr:menaquinone biosynthesis protein [Chitinophagaceae bacterium]
MDMLNLLPVNTNVLQRKIRVGAVNYLNTKPLIYGFEQGFMKEEIQLITDYPSKIADMLLLDEIDIGLVPVSIITELKEHHIISDYCIGCDGEVASVCLFSEVPMGKIESILLDYQSMTSVELIKILINQYWKIAPVLIPTSEDYRKNIKGTTAGLVIGDRALEQRKISKYIYDLGLEWKKFTGLPFVFAAWISNKKIDNSFIEKFNKANNIGLQNIETVISENPYQAFDLKEYYTNYINYMLDHKAKKGLKLFIKFLKEEKEQSEPFK